MGWFLLKTYEKWQVSVAARSVGLHGDEDWGFNLQKGNAKEHRGTDGYRQLHTKNIV